MIEIAKRFSLNFIYTYGFSMISLLSSRQNGYGHHLTDNKASGSNYRIYCLILLTFVTNLVFPHYIDIWPLLRRG